MQSEVTNGRGFGPYWPWAAASIFWLVTAILGSMNRFGDWYPSAGTLAFLGVITAVWIGWIAMRRHSGESLGSLWVLAVLEVGSGAVAATVQWVPFVAHAFHDEDVRIFWFSSYLAFGLLGMVWLVFLAVRRWGWRGGSAQAIVLFGILGLMGIFFLSGELGPQDSGWTALRVAHWLAGLPIAGGLGWLAWLEKRNPFWSGHKTAIGQD